MASSTACCFVYVLILLGAAAAAEGGLQCYESTCLLDDLTRCPGDDRAVLKDCNMAAFIAVLRAIKAPSLAKSIPFSMVCGKLGWEGDDAARRAVVLRMCVPDLHSLCETLQNYTVWVYRHRPPLVHYGCYFCGEDGCNGVASQRAWAWGVPALAAAAASLRLARHP